MEPIAIIGIGCRFPGANGPEEFWRLLVEGRDAVGEIPADRFDIDQYFDPTPGARGKIVTRAGGFLPDVDQFAASFFGISPREANGIDPNQRLLLEVAWEALEDAGQVSHQVERSNTGVFVGATYFDYQDLALDRPKELDIYMAAGVSPSVLPGRLSYILNAMGPSMAIDTACSSSLVAVHLACQSLSVGESTLALAGGVNLILQPGWYFGFSSAGMLSPDGRCKFGSPHADGFVRSEGVGVVVLKPLALAQADRDPIYAVIRGSGVDNDGRSSGYLMTPGMVGQAKVIREAYRRAGINPSDVQYVEAHGTGTKAGDPVEMEALASVVCDGRPEDHPCLVGSVKTNIGHTEGASGAAGLIKAALCLKHRAIPRSLHSEQLTPDIPWNEWGLVIPQEFSAWTSNGEPRLAGVSSFGIGGTNAHVVLEEAPSLDLRERRYDDSAELLTLSAESSDALQATARAYHSFLLEKGSERELRDLCYSASVRRAHFDYRLGVVATSREVMADQLNAFLQGEARARIISGRVLPDQTHGVVFIFPGQGSQWLGMGRDLLASEPAFRAEIERCDTAIRALDDWSLLDQLTADEEHSRLDDIGVIQPALFAIEVALAALWRSWGIEPNAVVGHSMGEVAAAYVAGVLTLDDAVKIICRRSHLLRRVRGFGSMVVVDLSLERAEHMIEGLEDRVSIAVSNSPTSTVLSGDATTLDRILSQLESEGVFCRRVKVDVASHSPQMDSLRDDLLQTVADVQPFPGSIPMYSTVTASQLDGLRCGAAYWLQNLRDPVLFSATVRQLLLDGHQTFIEMSPNPLLTTAVQQTASHAGREVTALPSLRRDEAERDTMLTSLGGLYASGHPIDWERVHGGEGDYIPLPLHQWQREHFWLESSGNVGREARRSSGGHPLLGERINVASQAGTYIWETDVDLESLPYLRDHRVQGSAVFPMTGYLEMALAAATEAFGSGVHALEDVRFEKALIFDEVEARTVQFMVTSGAPGMASFQVHSRASRVEVEEPWVMHTAGTIHVNVQIEAPPRVFVEELLERLSDYRSGDDHYDLMSRHGLDYGPTFQGVGRIWRSSAGEALAQVAIADTLASTPGYIAHPAILDACLQVGEHEALLAARGGRSGGTGDTYIPVSLRRLVVHGPVNRTAWGHARIQPGERAEADAVAGDMVLLDKAGQVLVEVQGVVVQRLERSTDFLRDWLYTMEWQPEPRASTEQGEAGGVVHGSWLIFTDRAGIGEQLASELRERGQTTILVGRGESFRGSVEDGYELDPDRLEDFEQLLHELPEAGADGFLGIIHLWSADTSATVTLADIEDAQSTGSLSGLHLVQAIAGSSPQKISKLYLVTRGALVVDGSEDAIALAHAPLHGLGRVIANEHPEFRPSCIDLSPRSSEAEVRELVEEVLADFKGDEVALRGSGRYVHRVVRFDPDAARSLEMRPMRTVDADEPYHLTSSNPGSFDYLVLTSTERTLPGPGEVEVRVHAAGLNFRDIMSALGMLLDFPKGFTPLGQEFAGTVTVVGEGVSDFKSGDAVVGFRSVKSFGPLVGSYATIGADFLVKKPRNLSFEDAATIPAVFITVQYAFELGRVERGERILIHSAAGGVGMAAIQMAQLVGMEIFATAGSPEKRDFLRSLGIQHVMDSRSLDFVREVMDTTNGEGVDVVLNSLASEYIPAGMSLLREGGRFLELGKTDIYRNTPLGLGHFRRSVSFSAIDLDLLRRTRPQLLSAVFGAIMKRVENGEIVPLPKTVFPVTDAASAFRYLAQARHIGKVVISLDVDRVDVVGTPSAPKSFRPDATYLITGGLGGLGLVIAEWMLQQGARHLVITGRRGITSETEPAVEALRSMGADVLVVQADVSVEDQVAEVIGAINHTMPPLRGVFHAAAILDDGILMQQTAERFRAVMAPKMIGAWTLHTLTRDMPLDFFVLFSSAANLIGSPGQANYVAANEFMDVLAHHRRARGLSALSINWGAWSEVGLAARPDRGGRLEARGMTSITPQAGLEAFGRALNFDTAQVGIVPMNWVEWAQFYPAASTSPLLSHVLVQPHGSGSDAANKRSGLKRDEIQQAPEEQRQEMVEIFIAEQLSKILRLSTQKVDRHQPLVRFGLDSLMAVELRTQIDVNLGVNIPVMKLLQDFTVSRMAIFIINEIDAPAVTVEIDQTDPLDTAATVAQSASTPTAASQVGTIDISTYVDQLSDDEVQSLLASVAGTQGSLE